MILQRGIMVAVAASVGLGATQKASALELDWSGQFRAETHWLYDYTQDAKNVTADPARVGKGGYYTPGGGSKNAFFQMLFLRLRPNIIVNDNIAVRSEWWVGSPITGMFGSAQPRTADQRLYYSTQSRGALISAQRLWGEFASDVGLVQVGRMPLNWGLGLVWNRGDGQWDRYVSTADGVRLVSKFGAFTVAPALLKYSMGNSIGGCTGCNGTGNGDVSDVSLQLGYDNLEEDFELGVNFIRRLAGAQQDPTSGFIGANGSTSGMVYTVWDIYARKRLGKFSIAGELPIANGTVGALHYEALAAGVETAYDFSDFWQAKIKAGYIPGQPSVVAGSVPTSFKGFMLHPNYRVGNLMFNYAYHRFAGTQSQNNPGTSEGGLSSPFDNPVTNAMYLSAGGQYRMDKWKFGSTWSFAQALEEPKVGQAFHYSQWDRQFVATNPGAFQGGKFLGWEMDYQVGFQWDDHFDFGFDLGWYFPGSFYAFSNTPQANGTSPVFGTQFKVSVNF